MQHDRDTASVIAVLRDAVVTSGLPQGIFARAVGTSPSRLSTYINGRTRPAAQFLFRARRVASALSAAADSGLLSAPAVAAALRELSPSEHAEQAWAIALRGREDLVKILAEEDQQLLDAWEAVPVSTGDLEWDILFADLVLAEYDKAGRTPPAWAQRDVWSSEDDASS